VYAKKMNGLFLVRIEDTDRERSTKEFEKNILDSLNLIGLSPDLEPINQSNRTEIYTQAAQKLFDEGKAYYCNCTKERLEEMRAEQQANGKKPQYDGKCRGLNLSKSNNTVLRLKTPTSGQVVMKDFVRGEISFNNEELDDLIILRSDGTPTYHLCNVVDDFEQNVTTVIRGEDHISNTPRQIHIQKALGYPELEYAHLPLVLGADKKRLSKRHAATSLEEYKNEGYLDSAILNTLARLGWSKGEKEVFYLEDLIRDFEITEIQKAGAIFDKTKLDWLNSQHLANIGLDEFKLHLKPFLEAIDINMNEHDRLDLLLNAMRSSETNLSAIANALKPYFKGVDSYDEKAVNKFLLDSNNTLTSLIALMEDHDVWNEGSLDILLKNFQDKSGLSTPKVNQPIRIALTGSTKSPSLGLTLEIVGKDESLKRMKAALDFIS
jgi:glutamyl-tRNA synthetase